MSLIIATGSNLGNREQNLQHSLDLLKSEFTFIHASRLYQSGAVDYEDQPDFLNQVVEFQLPSLSPQEVLEKCLNIENQLGRTRIVDKGPRTVDVDILFWGLESIHQDNLTIPHPRLFERSFVVLPLKELPYFVILQKHFSFFNCFDNCAYPYN